MRSFYVFCSDNDEDDDDDDDEISSTEDEEQENEDNIEEQGDESSFSQLKLEILQESPATATPSKHSTEINYEYGRWALNLFVIPYRVFKKIVPHWCDCCGTINSKSDCFKSGTFVILKIFQIPVKTARKGFSTVRYLIDSYSKEILHYFPGSSRNWTKDNEKSYKVSHSPYVLCVEAVDIKDASSKNETPSKYSH